MDQFLIFTRFNTESSPLLRLGKVAIMEVSLKPIASLLHLAVQLMLLFFVGEIFGKGQLIGYPAGAGDSPFMRAKRGEMEPH